MRGRRILAMVSDEVRERIDLMPCQDSLYESRFHSDSAFADSALKCTWARNAAVAAQVELCRVGGLVADGLVVEGFNYPPIPLEPFGIFDDEWGNRLKGMALEDIDKAHAASKHLRELESGRVTPECRQWLADHWRLDLQRLERDNERHKREILTPQYSRGPKHDKRVARIENDTKEIEVLKRRLVWAESNAS